VGEWWLDIYEADRIGSEWCLLGSVRPRTSDLVPGGRAELRVDDATFPVTVMIGLLDPQPKHLPSDVVAVRVRGVPSHISLPGRVDAIALRGQGRVKGVPG
jgi:hypothetical protein